MVSAESYENRERLTHAVRGPAGTVIAKTYGGPMGYGSPALIAEHAAREVIVSAGWYQPPRKEVI